MRFWLGVGLRNVWSNPPNYGRIQNKEQEMRPTVKKRKKMRKILKRNGVRTHIKKK